MPSRDDLIEAANDVLKNQIHYADIVCEWFAALVSVTPLLEPPSYQAFKRAWMPRIDNARQIQLMPTQQSSLQLNTLALYRDVSLLLNTLLERLKPSSLKTALTTLQAFEWQNANPRTSTAFSFKALYAQLTPIKAAYLAITELLFDERQFTLQRHVLLCADRFADGAWKAFVNDCLMGQVFQRRVEQGWGLLNQPQRIKRLTRRDRQHRQQTLLRLLKPEYIEAVAKEWRNKQHQTWQPWCKAIIQLSNWHSDWRWVLKRYRNVEAEKAWLKSLIEQMETLQKKALLGFRLAVQVETLLNYIKRDFFKQYFSNQSPAIITQNLAAFLQTNRHSFKGACHYFDDQETDIRKKTNVQTHILRKQISCHQRVMALMVLSVARHPDYQLGYEFSQLSLEAMDRSSQRLKDIELTSAQKAQLGRVSGTACLGIELALMRIMHTPYLFISMGSRVLMAQMDGWLRLGRVIDHSHRPRSNALGIIEHEKALTLLSGFLVQAVGSMCLAAFNLSTPIPLLALGVGYCLAVGAVELTSCVLNKAASPAQQSSLVIPKAVLLMWVYGQGFQRGLQFYGFLLAPFCEGIGLIESVGYFGLRAAFDKQKLSHAYHKLSLLRHPDKSADQMVTETMAQINAAYTCLKRYAF